MKRIIGSIRGLFEEVIAIDRGDDSITVYMNGIMVKHHFSSKETSDLRQQNNIDILEEFSKTVSESFYRQSGILVTPKKVKKSLLLNNRIRLNPFIY